MTLALPKSLPCDHAAPAPPCRWCHWAYDLTQTGRAMRARWRTEGICDVAEPSWTTHRPLLQATAPCRHLGAETGEKVVCPTCRGYVELKLFQCGKRGPCTVGKKAGETPCCLDGCYEGPLPPPVAPLAGRIRHLLYHIFPHAENGGAVWRWNVAELRKRLSLFNGRRVVGIATDASTEPASAVKDALAGCGCEFIEVPNNATLREGATFHALHERVAAFTGPEDATLFGHAKGITSQKWAPGARPWTESLYATCLDHWPAVASLLATHPMVGPWKRLGYGFPESQRSDWHFSGSWRWFRNADFFSRNWRELEQFWCAVESQPSLIFRSHEAACIVGEFSHSGLALYRGEEWDGWAGQALRDWKEQHRADVQTPVLLTSILCSHQKPATIHETVRSILVQTSADWQLVIIDSGSLMEELKPYESDPRVKVVLSPDGSRPQGWQYNQVLRQGLALGDLLHYMTDDDVLDPSIFAAWIDAARANPDQSAWYGWADRTEVRRDGSEVKLGELPQYVLVRTIGGVGGERLNCKIDGIQVCHRREVVAPWPEEREAGWNADGRFLDALGERVAIYPLAAKVGRHRHCNNSTFTKSSDAPP